jgi:eukaryotic-like serine/threonine-protein kinase
MAEAASPPLKVLGRYALHEAIASGGMATVHFGRLLGPVGFARTVAIKRLHERLAQDPEFTSMFLDEARLAARIRHPNVVPTLDVVSMDSELFLVMEYVQGESLGRLYKRENDKQTRMRIPVLTTLIAGALHGLHAAHEATSESGEPLGLIHRDISPQNILVGVDGVARVLDFGVAKAAGRASTTRDGQLKGKLSYMAPEQLRGKNITRAIDIYAAGVVLWEGLVGRKLYKADSEAELVTLVVEANVDPPSQHAPDISPELDAFVLKALSRDPTKRFATAREMAKALEKLMPPVPASEIGEYVEEVAGTALAARSQRISLIERSSTSDVTAIGGSQHETVRGTGGSAKAAPTSEPALGVAASEAETGLAPGSPETSLTNASAIEIPVHGPRGKKMYVIAVVAAIALAGIMGLTVMSFSSRGGNSPSTASPPAASPTTPATTSSSAVATPPPPTPSTESASPPPPVESAASTKTTAAVPAKPPVVVVAKTAGTTALPTAKTSASPPPPAPNCDPPYVVDANGVRRYKRECAR